MIWMKHVEWLQNVGWDCLVEGMILARRSRPRLQIDSVILMSNLKEIQTHSIYFLFIQRTPLPSLRKCWKKLDLWVWLASRTQHGEGMPRQRNRLITVKCTSIRVSEGKHKTHTLYHKKTSCKHKKWAERLGEVVGKKARKNEKKEPFYMALARNDHLTSFWCMSLHILYTRFSSLK